VIGEALDRALANVEKMVAVARTKVPAATVPGIMAGGPTAWLSEAPQLAVAFEQERHFFGWVFSAVRAIAQRIAAQPVRMARKVKAPRRSRMPQKHTLPYHLKDAREGLEMVTRHIILDSIDKPNDYMVRSSLLLNTVTSLELTGRFYWWLVDEVNRVAIYPIPSSWVEPRHDGGQLFSSYIIRPRATGGATIEYRIDGREIIRGYYPDPSNPLRGHYSPLTAAARAVLTDEAIQQAQHQHFVNGIWPGLALIVGRHPDASAPNMPGQRPALTKEQRAQLLTAVKQAYRGAFHYGEPLILDAIIQDVKKVTNSVQEMDFKDSGEIVKARVFQAFGVNPVVVGQLEGVNRASATMADANFCRNCVNPKLVILGEWLSKQLPGQFGDPDLVLWLQEARPDDPLETRAEMALLVSAGAISVNELRSVYNFGPVDGGDRLIQPRPVAGADGKGITDYLEVMSAAAGEEHIAHGDRVAIWNDHKDTLREAHERFRQEFATVYRQMEMERTLEANGWPG
jgi:phage portal protein BeeE